MQCIPDTQNTSVAKNECSPTIKLFYLPALANAYTQIKLKKENKKLHLALIHPRLAKKS